MKNKRPSIAFVWHWQKRLTGDELPVFAVPDAMIHAIGRLSERYDVRLLALCNDAAYEVFSERQNIRYIFRRDVPSLLKTLHDYDPDYLFINHHPLDYKNLLREMGRLRAKSFLYYSAPIKKLSKYHLKLSGHLVHHPYQKEMLLARGVHEHQIHIAPKSADMALFHPVALPKKWDCIYPARGSIGYWKRPELAIEACRLNEMTLVMPGAKIPPEYHWVTTFDAWQSPGELALLYNQSRCLVITSDDEEMGPRVIPEAAACNLPIVCCRDSRACVSHVEKLGGFIAEPTAEDIAEKIRMAVSIPAASRQKMIEAGYDYDILYKKIEAIIKEGEERAEGGHHSSLSKRVMNFIFRP